jgi:hypothetical protein
MLVCPASESLSRVAYALNFYYVYQMHVSDLLRAAVAAEVKNAETSEQLLRGYVLSAPLCVCVLRFGCVC